jgi:hypothetical protein
MTDEKFIIDFNDQIKGAEDRLVRYNEELMAAPIAEVSKVDIKGVEEARDVLADAWLVYKGRQWTGDNS